MSIDHTRCIILADRFLLVRVFILTLFVRRKEKGKKTIEYVMIVTTLMSHSLFLSFEAMTACVVIIRSYTILDSEFFFRFFTIYF